MKMSASTHFAFRHKVFSVEGSYFSSHRDGSDPYFAVPMGEAMALLRISGLRKEFDIADDSEDSRLLDTVERALKYMKVIRVNDSIPNELLDGSASWSVEDRHRAIAKGRLTLHLVGWVTGKKANLIDLARDLESPQVKQKVRESIEELTRRLGLAKDDTAKVERRIDDLAHELSYIEGLRERLMTIHGIETMIDDAAKLCQQRLSVRDSVERTPVLLTYAFKRLDSEFELLDKQNQNILDVLADVETHISLIRAIRDEIHCTLMIWDALVDAWQAHRLKGSEETAASLLHETHRFLAENYPVEMVW
jgi:hypothetical protein